MGIAGSFLLVHGLLVLQFGYKPMLKRGNQVGKRRHQPHRPRQAAVLCKTGWRSGTAGGHIMENPSGPGSEGRG